MRWAADSLRLATRGSGRTLPAMPIVSVVMAFHRVTPYLRPAVRSVLNQTLLDLELVLVNNGTSEGRSALAEDGHDPRIRVITHATNLGIAVAHNAAVAAARGEFVALLDYDDLALPARLEKQIAALRANPKLGLVSSFAESIDGEGRVTGREFSLEDSDEQLRYSQYAAPVVTPAYCGRREVFTRFPHRPEFSFGADFDFLTRAMEVYPAEAVPEVLLRYRHHPGQTTVEQAGRIARERCEVRLLTARRRAGRSEGEDWRQRLARGATNEEVGQGEMLRGYARRFLAEGFPVQAAYHARQGLKVQRSPVGVWQTGRLLAQIRRRAGEDRALAMRMFFKGPVEALEVMAARP
jgi:Glycosyl transferase family 2